MSHDEIQNSLNNIDRTNAFLNRQLTKISSHYRQEFTDYIRNHQTSKIFKWLSVFRENYRRFKNQCNIVFNNEDHQVLLWKKKQKMSLLCAQHGPNYLMNELKKIKQHIEQLYKIVTCFQSQLNTMLINVRKSNGVHPKKLVEFLNKLINMCHKFCRYQIICQSYLVVEQSQVLRDDQDFRVVGHFLLPSILQSK